MPQEPVPPAAMEKFDEAGAKAFAEFYWDVVTYAQATGDTELLESLETSGCDACQGGRKWIDDIYNDGRRLVGNRITATASQAIPVGDADTSTLLGFNVTISIRSGGGQVLNSKGTVTEEQRADVMDLVMFVHVADARAWQVGDWKLA